MRISQKNQYGTLTLLRIRRLLCSNWRSVTCFCSYLIRPINFPAFTVGINLICTVIVLGESYSSHYPARSTFNSNRDRLLCQKYVCCWSKTIKCGATGGGGSAIGMSAALGAKVLRCLSFSRQQLAGESIEANDSKPNPSKVNYVNNVMGFINAVINIAAVDTAPEVAKR